MFFALPASELKSNIFTK